MGVLGGTSVLHEFFQFMEARARSFSYPGQPAAQRDFQHELDSFLSLALAAYEELGESTREATAHQSQDAPRESVISGVREAHARYLQACQPLLQLIERARPLSVIPRRLEQFMASVGEANLIAHHFDRVMQAEREAEQGQTRSLKEVSDGLRRRTHANGGTRD